MPKREFDWSGVQFTGDWISETNEQTRRIENYQNKKSWDDTFWSLGGGIVGFLLGGPTGAMIGSSLGSLAVGGMSEFYEPDLSGFKFNKEKLSDVSSDIDTAQWQGAIEDIFSIGRSWLISELGKDWEGYLYEGSEAELGDPLKNVDITSGVDFVDPTLAVADPTIPDTNLTLASNLGESMGDTAFNLPDPVSSPLNTYDQYIQNVLWRTNNLDEGSAGTLYNPTETYK